MTVCVCVCVCVSVFLCSCKGSSALTRQYCFEHSCATLTLGGVSRLWGFHDWGSCNPRFLWDWLCDGVGSVLWVLCGGPRVPLMTVSWVLPGLIQMRRGETDWLEASWSVPSSRSLASRAVHWRVRLVPQNLLDSKSSESVSKIGSFSSWSHSVPSPGTVVTLRSYIFSEAFYACRSKHNSVTEMHWRWQATDTVLYLTFSLYFEDFSIISLLSVLFFNMGSFYYVLLLFISHLQQNAKI